MIYLFIFLTSVLGDQTCNGTPSVIFLIGGPGSGKGTQALKLTQKYPNILHVSSGEVIRQALQTAQDPETQEVREIVSSGGLAPNDYLLKHLYEELKKQDCNSLILLDGFPRSMENVLAWNRDMNGGMINLKAVVYFELGYDILEGRLLERAKYSGRLDDTPETIKRRIQLYRNETEPIVSYFMDLQLLIKVNADQSVEDVFLELDKKLTHKLT